MNGLHWRAYEASIEQPAAVSRKCGAHESTRLPQGIEQRIQLAAQVAPQDTLREPFSRTDLLIEVVLWWRQRAGPARVEGAGGVIRKVKVEDERVPRRITAQVRALRAVEQVATRSVGVHAVRCIAERQ